MVYIHKSFNACTYTHRQWPINLHVKTQVRFNNHTGCSLYWSHDNQFRESIIDNGSITARVRLKPTILVTDQTIRLSRLPDSITHIMAGANSANRASLSDDGCSPHSKPKEREKCTLTWWPLGVGGTAGQSVDPALTALWLWPRAGAAVTNIGRGTAEVRRHVERAGAEVLLCRVVCNTETPWRLKGVGMQAMSGASAVQ